MVPGETRNPLTELRRGVLEYCVLAVVRDDESYAFDIVRRLASAGELVTSEGTIYPLLSRLRRDRLVTTTWRESDAGPPRRYYRITDDGRRALDGFTLDWAEVSPRRRRHPRRGELRRTHGGRGSRQRLPGPARAGGAAAAPADRRGELIAEVQEHIESALTEAGSRDEVTARNVLERLGAPEEIVAAETGGDGSPAATPPPTPVVERGGRWGTMRAWRRSSS